MTFNENQQLFGFDPTEKIVAVEFSEPDLARVFVRQEDGTTAVQAANFTPFLWNAQSGEKLSGDLALSHLMKFPSWLDYQAARMDLQKNGVSNFSLNDPVQQYLTSTGRTLFKGMEFEDLRRLQIYVEREGDAVRTIALGDGSGWEEAFSVNPGMADSEKAVLEWLTTVVRQRDPDVIEGHHLFKEKLSWISARAKKLKVRLGWGRDGEPLTSRSSRLQIAEKAIQYPKFAAQGRHFVDTWLLAQYYDISSRELENFDLESVAGHFGLEGGEGAAALQGLRKTRALSGILSRSYFIQAQIFPYNFQDVIIRGNATKIDALFLREYLRRGHGLPDFPEARAFEGGYTDIFATGVIENVWHCDATSLYPSVMLAFGYTPQNDALGAFRDLLKDLRTFRLETKIALKSSADEAERSRLDALQTTFKILINSFYGYLGFAQGHFADFAAAENVTAKGREILRQMVEWLGRHGARVIEIDTDGIYFQPPENARIEVLQKGLAQELPPGIEVDFDKCYRAMFSYKAKNYALLEESGALVIKGAALKSRGMEPFLREYLEGFLRHLLEGNPKKAESLREEFADRIRRHSLPIAALAKTEALQDSLAAYQKKIGASSRNRSAAFELAIKSGRAYQAGDQVSYYVIGTKKKITAYENARLVTEWQGDARDENVEYYVGKLEELAKKFASFVSLTPPAAEVPAQTDLFG